MIRKKFRSAQTDSGREIRRGDDKPGITNLIDILAVVSERTPEEIERRTTARATATSRGTSATPSRSD